jgi:hypothetical protein
VKFKVIPIDFDDNENEALEKALKIFNSSQKVYHLDKNNSQKFSDDENIEWLKIYKHLLPTENDLRILAVTSKSFSDNWFSHTDNKVTVISVSDWRKFYSPPGIHCYLLLEFILSIFFHSSNFEEIESKPHSQTIGCLLDLCENKSDMIWKLRTGYLCSKHASLFLSNGGTEKQLRSIKKLLYQTRKVTLGIASNEKSNERETTFSIDSIKRHPIVVAGIIFFTAISLGFGISQKLFVEPKIDRIEQLEKEIEKCKEDN